MKWLKYNNHLLRLMVILLITCNVLGCQRQIKAKIEFSNAEIDFGSYQDFSWPDYKPLIKQSSHIQPDTLNQIKVAVQQTIESKGYHFILNPTTADFIVSYALSSSNEEDYEPASALEIDNGKCNHPLSEPYNETIYTTDNEDVFSILILSVFDVNRCMVVWQARIKTQFNPHRANLNQSHEIKETIKELLSDFPIKNQ